MTDTLELTQGVQIPEALAKLERLRKYFASRFAMWKRDSSDLELFIFSFERMKYPTNITDSDKLVVEVEFKVWTEKGQLPEHILLWHQTSITDLMHLRQ